MKRFSDFFYSSVTEKAVSQYSNDELSIAFNGGKGYGFFIEAGLHSLKNEDSGIHDFGSFSVTHFKETSSLAITSR